MYFSHLFLHHGINSIISRTVILSHEEMKNESTIKNENNTENNVEKETKTANKKKIAPPEIVQLTPSYFNYKGNDKVVISFQYSKKVQQKTGFCKFTNTVVEGNITSNNEIICFSPPIDQKVTQLTISFDSENWSTMEKAVGVQQPLDPKKLAFDVIGCIFVFSGVPSCVRAYFCKRKKTTEFDIIKDPEEEPILKKDQENGESLFGSFK